MQCGVVGRYGAESTWPSLQHTHLSIAGASLCNICSIQPSPSIVTTPALALAPHRLTPLDTHRKELAEPHTNQPCPTPSRSSSRSHRTSSAKERTLSTAAPNPIAKVQSNPPSPYPHIQPSNLAAALLAACLVPLYSGRIGGKMRSRQSVPRRTTVLTLCSLLLASSSSSSSSSSWDNQSTFRSAGLSAWALSSWVSSVTLSSSYVLLPPPHFVMEGWVTRGSNGAGGADRVLLCPGGGFYNARLGRIGGRLMLDSHSNSLDRKSHARQLALSTLVED